MARGSGFRMLRIAILLYVLLMVAVGSWMARERTTSWSEPLWVAIYPLAGDESAGTHDYLQRLDIDKLKAIERYFSEQALRYTLNLQTPIRVELTGQIRSPPPARDAESGILGNALWSLKMRWYAWSVANDLDRPRPDIQIFAVFHDPAISPSLPHSAGLAKGLIGVAHLFASKDQDQQNLIVITHELLHILGASDKYDPHSNQPLFPIGYAEPDRRPLYPQRKAEIMAGRTPQSAAEARMPAKLSQTLIGPQTALEIRWVR
jgi:hypothetical protein